MAKGLQSLYLLEVKLKRKMEKVRRKIRETDNGGSPSSEDSELDELAPKIVKKEPDDSSSGEGDGEADKGMVEVVLPEAKEGKEAVVVKQEVQKQEVPGVVVTEMKKKTVASDVPDMDTMLALRQKAPNYYTKVSEDGVRVLRCRRCVNDANGDPSTTSHSKDALCGVVVRP
jgi:hypothetical protein